MKKNILRQIIRHAKEEFPNEACGILAARLRRGRSARGGNVEKIYKMSNIEKSPVGFFMDLKEQFDVARQIRSEDLCAAAIYHSHPNAPPYPSALDKKLALDPSVSYIIVSIKEETCEIRDYSGAVLLYE